MITLPAALAALGPHIAPGSGTARAPEDGFEAVMHGLVAPDAGVWAVPVAEAAPAGSDGEEEVVAEGAEDTAAPGEPGPLPVLVPAELAPGLVIRTAGETLDGDRQEAPVEGGRLGAAQPSDRGVLPALPDGELRPGAEGRAPVAGSRQAADPSPAASGPDPVGEAAASGSDPIAVAPPPMPVKAEDTRPARDGLPASQPAADEAKGGAAAPAPVEALARGEVSVEAGRATRSAPAEPKRRAVPVEARIERVGISHGAGDPPGGIPAEPRGARLESQADPVDARRTMPEAALSDRPAEEPSPTESVDALATEVRGDLGPPVPQPKDDAAPAVPRDAQVRSPLVQAALDRILPFRPQEGETLVRLNPHGLGVIEVVVQDARDGGLDVTLRVQNPLVLEALRQERDAVAQALVAPQGGAAGSLSMDLFQSGGGQRGGNLGAGAPTAPQAETGQEQPMTETAPDMPVLRSDHVNILT